MYKLGDLKTSEELIKSLYIDLRRQVNAWASITKQTAQARMGYIGQHLVSVATGFPGGRSGARGKDIILPDGAHAEIKTCYRVDQLGACSDCGSAVASIELDCHICDSSKIVRKDDSKWLIGLRTELEYSECIDPKFYYLVLFEFEDLAKPETIVASIWSVDPRVPGFAYAMIDYRENIKAKSKSGAPFNLWPHQLKFFLMRPTLIYQSLIYKDDTIKTRVFPGVGDAPMEAKFNLAELSRSQNLTEEKVAKAADILGIKVLEGKNKRAKIEALVDQAAALGIDTPTFVDAISYALYREDIECHLPNLPNLLKNQLDESGLLN